MKTHSKILLPMFAVFAFLGLCFAPMFAAAIGIMSEPINVDNARRGQTHWEEFLFINSSDTELTFNLTAEGVLAKWVSFYKTDNKESPITQLVVPAGTNLAAAVKFTIPGNTANGKYQGSLVGTTVVSAAQTSAENSAQITQKLDREVNITVTDNQILDFKTYFTPVAYSMATGVPFQVKVSHQNNGNVDIKPDIELRISRDGQEIFNAIFPYPNNTPAIQPNERKEILDQVVWRTVGYEAGKYSVVLSTMVNGQQNQKEEFFITLGANGASASLGAGLSAFLKNGNLIWPIVAGIILIAAGMIAVLLKKKNSLVKN